MIKLIDNNFDRLDELKKLLKKDCFGVRILSYLETYELTLDFVDIWYQENKKGKIISAIARLEDRYTIASCIVGRRNKYLDELEEFINFRSPYSVMFDFKIGLDFDNKKVIFGDCLKFKHANAHFKKMDLVHPGTVYYYSILQKCESEDFPIPDYMHFLSDVTYRKNRDRVMMFGLEFEESIATVCMTVAESDDAVILGAVATAPEYRNKGLASKCVNFAASLLALNQKEVYILSRKDSTTKLYKKCGFKKTQHFIEYIFR